MTGSSIFSVNFANRKNLAKPNYHMSIKKSEAILKCFIDLKSSVWFTLGSEDKTMFCETSIELFSARLPVKVFKTLYDRQSCKFHKIEKFQLVICRLRLSQAILKCLIDLKNSVWFRLGSENETMSYDT